MTNLGAIRAHYGLIIQLADCEESGGYAGCTWQNSVGKMSNFVRRRSQLEKVPTLLAERAKGFCDSPEYRELRPYEVTIPGVVCGAFAKYLQRIHEALMKSSGEGNEVAVQSAHDVLEFLSSSPESAVQELVMDEIYENLDCPPAVLTEIEKRLGTAARRLLAEKYSEQ